MTDPQFLSTFTWQIARKTLPPVLALAALSSNAMADKVTGLSDSQESGASNIVDVCVGLNAKATGNNDINIPPTDAQVATLTSNEQDLLRRCADAIEAGGLGIKADRATAKTNAEAKIALSQIAPDEIAAQGTTSVRAVNVQQDNIAARISALQSGFRGVSVGQLSLNLDGRQFTGNDLLSMSGGSAGESGGRARLGAFINGQFNFGDKEATGREAGFDFDGGGLTVGLDYFISGRAFVGAAVGVNTTSIDIDHHGGGLDTDTVSLSLYGSFFQSDKFHINGLLEYANDDHSTRRNLDYTLNETSGGCCEVGLTGDTVRVNQAALGSADGDQFTVAVNLGYSLGQGGFSYGPLLDLSYTKVNIDAFDERMSNPEAVGRGLALHIASQEITSTKSELGFAVDHTGSQTWGVLTQQLRLSWLHEFDDDNRLIEAHYLYDPAKVPLNLNTDDIDSDYFSVNLGLSAGLSRGRSAYFSYGTLIGLEDITYHGLNAGYRMEF